MHETLRLGCVQCAANDHFTIVLKINHQLCMTLILSSRPTGLSFQALRQFPPSHFLAPLYLIITLITFLDRITTVSLLALSLSDLALTVLCTAGVSNTITTPTTDSKLVTGDLDSSLANLASNLNFGPAANR